jgi:hypothetical protein
LWRLEPSAVKVARWVLRGAALGNKCRLPDKPELVFDLKMYKFNFKLEGVEENSVKLTWPFSHIHVLQGIQASCLSDVSLAFAVQDVPSEALAFSNKAEEH